MFLITIQHRINGVGVGIARNTMFNSEYISVRRSPIHPNCLPHRINGNDAKQSAASKSDAPDTRIRDKIIA